MIAFVLIALAVACIAWALVRGGTDGKPLSRKDIACMIACYAIVYVPLIIAFWP
jgi:predicted nucleic acid-binding protein